MEKDLLRVLQACVGAVVLLITAMLLFGLFPRMNSDTGAAWAGALFAGLAFAGTIWIATSQKRAADHAAKLLGTVTLMSMQFRLNNLRRQLEKIAIALDKWQPESNECVNYEDAGKTIKIYAILEVDEVEKVLPLDKDVAIDLAVAIGYIAYCSDLLEGASSNPKIRTPVMQQHFCSEMSELLARAAMNIRGAMILASRIAGRQGAEFESNDIPEIARKNFFSGAARV
jgi:hypothetical protein